MNKNELTFFKLFFVRIEWLTKGFVYIFIPLGINILECQWSDEFFILMFVEPVFHMLLESIAQGLIFTIKSILPFDALTFFLTTLLEVESLKLNK